MMLSPSQAELLSHCEGEKTVGERGIRRIHIEILISLYFARNLERCC